MLGTAWKSSEQGRSSPAQASIVAGVLQLGLSQQGRSCSPVSTAMSCAVTPVLGLGRTGVAFLGSLGGVSLPRRSKPSLAQPLGVFPRCWRFAHPSSGVCNAGEASTCGADGPAQDWGHDGCVTPPGCELWVREHSMSIPTAHSHPEPYSPPSWAQWGQNKRKSRDGHIQEVGRALCLNIPFLPDLCPPKPGLGEGEATSRSVFSVPG